MGLIGCLNVKIVGTKFLTSDYKITQKTGLEKYFYGYFQRGLNGFKMGLSIKTIVAEIINYDFVSTRKTGLKTYFSEFFPHGLDWLRMEPKHLNVLK